MSRSRSRRGTARGRCARGRGPWPGLRRRLPLILLALGALGVVVWVGYLDSVVRERFAGALWRTPAQVYARPLELYLGLEYDAEQLEAYLLDAGYRPVGAPARPGEFQRSGQRLTLVTRPFRFWDGLEASQTLTLRFRGGRLAALQGADGRQVPHARLEPLRIGSLFPAAYDDRDLLRLDEVPPALVEAVLSVEDREFVSHHGIRPLSILRALWANLRAGRTVQGGSTLTQQLVKNLFLTPERSLGRKVTEAVMAVLLEMRFSKRQILEAYCNEVYLGQSGQRSVHGFAMASRFLFNRPLQELDLSQLVLMAAMVKGPSHYDPRRHPQRARERRDLVLRAMAELGSLDQAVLQRALAEPLGVVALEAVRLQAYPAYLDLVRLRLEQDYEGAQLQQAGLRVFTHLELRTQQRVEAAIDRELPRLERAAGLGADALQVAALIADRETGEVRALAGGRQHRLFGFNRVLHARRPVGSLVKPAVFLTALLDPARYTLASRLSDEPFRLEQPGSEPWEPVNFDQTSHGEVGLGEALVQSYNLATARMGLALGTDRVVATLRRLGIARDLPTHPAMLLGALELSPLEVAQVYQALAAGGFPVPLQAVQAVLDAEGRPLHRYALQLGAGVDPRAVYLLNTLLARVTIEGTASALTELLPEHPVAGKTGSSDGLRDSWFAGFDSRRLAVAWVGRDDNQSMGLSGAGAAVPVWAAMMRGSAAPGPLLVEPAGLERAWIEPDSGLLSAEHCVSARSLPFIAGSAPRDRSECGGRGPSGVAEWVRGWLR